MRHWLLLASLLCAQAFGQQAYRWVDESGQVHYSDRPAPGATQITLQGAQSYTAVTPRPAPAEQEAQPAADDAQPYRMFNVIKPSQQETLWNIEAVLDVQVELQPRLQPGHHLGVYLDGTLVDVGARSTQFQLNDVFRGRHDLQAVILDARGEEVLRTSAVAFMVQQTSILNPNNPNANAQAR